jgi:hypothetical protein
LYVAKKIVPSASMSIPNGYDAGESVATDNDNVGTRLTVGMVHSQRKIIIVTQMFVDDATVA